LDFVGRVTTAHAWLSRGETADVACNKVTSLGGKAKPAFDIMDRGRMAVCTDPNGAEFDVWEPKKLLGTDVDSSLHGVPSWFETMTTDIDRTGVFYSGLFGWTQEVTPTPGSNYTTFNYATTPVAGIMAATPQMGQQRPDWRPYFTVKNADETAREAVDLGAGLCVALRDIPGIGRFGGITSPQGVTFCVIKYSH
jgi:predicted enzyme related to lactoylglutathione lyase